MTVLYRALKFENITYSLDRDDNKRWTILENSSSADKSWWNDKQVKKDHINEFSSKHLLNNADNFIKNSIFHSAYKGGRFNPPKSCTALYLSDHAITACLEVSYHILVDNLNSIRHFKKFNDWSKNIYTRSFPSNLEFKIFVFKIKIDNDKLKLYDLSDFDKLKKLLISIGYGRYIHNINKQEIYEFISGNDYYICRQISAALLSKNYNGIIFNSARLEQSKNIVLLNTKDNIELKKEYAVIDIEIQPSTGLDPHIFIIKQNGKSIQKFKTPQIIHPKVKIEFTKYFYPKEGTKDDYTKIILQKFSKI